MSKRYAVALLLIASRSIPYAGEVSRLAVPSGDALNRARARIERSFGRDPTTPEEKRVRARSLLKEAVDQAAGHTYAYALLDAAQQAGALVGEVSVIGSAIETLAFRFGLPEGEVKRQWVKAWNCSVKNKLATTDLADRYGDACLA